MPSFQLSVTPSRRAATRFITRVRRNFQRVLAEEPNIKQTDLARAIGVHRSVINKEIRGQKDLTLGRVAELAWALGYEPQFSLAKPQTPAGSNVPQPAPGFKVSSDTTQAHFKYIPTKQLGLTV
jgi:hypothetical protein